VTDDDLLADIGDPALGAVTTHHYSAAHDSPENTAFLEAYAAANDAKIGKPNNTGTRILCVSGDVQKPGYYEIEVGNTAADQPLPTNEGGRP
jgi:hypothetical protein